MMQAKTPNLRMSSAQQEATNLAAKSLPVPWMMCDGLVTIPEDTDILHLHSHIHISHGNRISGRFISMEFSPQQFS